MKRIICLLAVLSGMAFSLQAAQYNSCAKKEACVECGNARFTILTDRLIRMEWSSDARFEDRASLGIVNRDLPLCKFSVEKRSDGVVIKTPSVSLTYTGVKGDVYEKFDSENLKVSFKLNGKSVAWHPGSSAEANLRGTMRTLDRVKDRRSKTALNVTIRNSDSMGVKEMENGILSRDGWAVIDESFRQVMEKNDSDWGEWVTNRPEGDRQDLYIFAYGHDYKAAMKDFTRVAGNIPMPPKFAFGYWWSRYWRYTDDEMIGLATEMRDRQIPIDVFVVDMDWHHTWPDLKDRRKEEFDQKFGWTGYSWNNSLIPDPKGFLNHLHSLGYKTSLNLHPASGIQPYEECYRRFVDDYLKRTSDYDGPKDYIYGKEPYVFKGNSESFAREGYCAPVPFRLDQQAWADAYFSQVIRPLEKTGVDFWWLDWQQFLESKYVNGLSNTYWCNWAFFNDKLRQGKRYGKYSDRPFIYHRWGGIGSHRYPLGFSGDISDEWSALSFLPYFTSSSSNVGYCYWGHDIGGHMQVGKREPTDPEKYTRWLQYGVFTPIFKTHSTRAAHLERKIWAYPSHYQYMKEAIELRYALSPYIYTASRQAFDTGIGMCRPLYYEYPEDNRAYELDEEFFFGDNILATVLCQPSVDGKTERTMWFPSGCDWYDMGAHTMRKGGTTQKLYYAIDQNPWYVRAGAIIPLAPEGIRNLQDNNPGLRLLVVPGSSFFSTRLYEDDGTSQAYDTEYSFTTISRKSAGRKTVITVGAREGEYRGALAEREITLLMEGVKSLPKTVRLNGAVLSDCASMSGTGAVIKLPSTSAKEETVVEMVF